MTNEQLVARIQAGENEAENMLELWQQNTGFIGKMAMDYIGYAEIEDLKQEGYIGLCEAVRHYDPEQGASFIHYAAFWIKQTMKRYIVNCCSNVRIPEYTRNHVTQYKKISSEFHKCYGKDPTDREMRALLDVSEERLREIKRAVNAMNSRSLNEVIGGEDDDFTLEDTLASDVDLEEDVTKKLDTAVMKEILWAAVDNLDERQAELLHCHYQDGMSLNACGKSKGLTGERARQIKETALKKLRRPRRCASLKCYYEQYIAAAPVHHVGVGTFNRTWTSATELEALRNIGCE